MPSMKVITPGHRYELENFENKEAPGQQIQFIQKAHLPDQSMVTEVDGTTNEELLKVLIDRLTAMGAKFPYRENSIAITYIETALLWLEKRTANRRARGVEGKAIA